MFRIFASCLIICVIVGCGSHQNHFYDAQGEKIAKKIASSLNGFDLSQRKVFEEKSTHSKNPQDFHRA